MAGIATPYGKVNRNTEIFSLVNVCSAPTTCRKTTYTKQFITPTSPIPMKARVTSRNGNPSLAAMGVKAVAIDHQTTPNPKTSLPPTVSAHIPPATCFFSFYDCIIRTDDKMLYLIDTKENFN